MDSVNSVEVAEEVSEENKVKMTRKEETIKRQILTNARKYLAELAAKQQEETGAYRQPTKDEIAAECKKRWKMHLDRKKGKEDISAYFD